MMAIQTNPSGFKKTVSTLALIVFSSTQSLPAWADTRSISVFQTPNATAELRPENSNQRKSVEEANPWNEDFFNPSPVTRRQADSSVSLPGDPAVTVGSSATRGSTSFRVEDSSEIHWNFNLSPPNAVSHLAIRYPDRQGEDLSGVDFFKFRILIKEAQNCRNIFSGLACFQLRFEDADGDRVQFAVQVNRSAVGKAVNLSFTQQEILRQNSRFDLDHLKEISFIKTQSTTGLSVVGSIDIEVGFEKKIEQGEDILPSSKGSLTKLPGLGEVAAFGKKSEVDTLADNRYRLKYDPRPEGQEGMSIVFDGMADFDPARPLVLALRSLKDTRLVRLRFWDSAGKADFVDLVDISSRKQFWRVDLKLLKAVNLNRIKKISLVAVPERPSQSSGELEVEMLIDTRPPQGRIVINGGDAVARGLTVDLTLSAQDPQSGVTKMAFSEDGVRFSTPVAFRTQRQFRLSEGGDGQRRIFVKFFDDVGNESKVFSDTITLDRPPHQASVVINGGDSQTNSPEAVLSLNAQDRVTSQGELQIAFSVDGGATFTDFEPFAEQKSLTVDGADGQKTVIVRYQDEIGNTVDVQDTIVLDRAGPVGTVVINDNSPSSNSTDVILTLDATDANTTQQNLRVAFSQDGFSFTPFEPFTATKAFTLDGGGDLKLVVVSFLDEAGNETFAFATVTLDQTAPVGTVNINNFANTTNDPDVVLTLDANDTLSLQANLQMAFSQDGGQTFTAFEAFNAQKNLTLEGNDGVKTVTVRYRDEAGNTEDFQDTITLDRAAPVGTVNINNFANTTNDPDAVLTLDANDAFSLQANLQMAFSQDGITFTNFEAFNAQKNLTLEGSDGVKTVTVRYRDEAGNTEDFQDTITLDRAAPAGTVTINNNANTTNDPDVVLTLDANDTLSSQPNLQMAFSQDGITFTSFEAFNAQKNLTLEGNDGVKTVTVRYRDEAGNTEDFQDTITLDRAAPVGTVNINNNANTTNDPDAVLTLDANDAFSLQPNLQMAFSQDGITFTSFEAFNAQKNLTLEGNDGVKTVTVRYRDEAGNTEDFQDTITLDREVPAGSLTINDGASHTNSPDLVLALEVDDAVSQDQNIQIAFSQDGMNFSPFEPFSAQKFFKLEGTDELKSVTMRYKDEAGNTFDTQDTITLDRAAPNGATISINNDAVSTNSLDVILNLDATDALTLTANLQMAFSQNGVNYTPFEPFNAQKNLTLEGDVDGNRVVIVRYRDEAGNTADAQDAITLDRTAPAGTVSINNEAVFTSSADITLTLDANDTLSLQPNLQMAFSQDGVTFTAFEPFNAQKNLTLEGNDGVKTVTVRYRDEAGNTEDFQDTITLDRPPIQGSIAINSGNNFTNSADITLTLDATDVLTSQPNLQMAFSQDGITFTAFEAFNIQKNLTLEGADGAKTVTVRYRDEAGNTADFEDDITLDQSAPAGTVIFNEDRQFTNTKDVRVDFNVQDQLSQVIEAAFSVDDGVTFTDFVPVAEQMTATLPEGEGLARTITARLRDEAGNTVDFISNDIVLDQTAPPGSVVINDGQSYTNDPDMTLTLEVDDNLTSDPGILIAVSLDGGITFSDFEPFFDVQRNVTLPGGDGHKKVIVRYQDEAGNTADFSDTIILDRTPPGPNHDAIQGIPNPTPDEDDRFGAAVAVSASGQTLVGASGDDAAGLDAGAAYLFDDQSNLTQTFVNPNAATRAGDSFGNAVTFVGDNILIAAVGDPTGLGDAGLAFLFDPSGNLLQTFSDPQPGRGDQFGFSLASSPSQVAAIGTPQDLVQFTFGGTVHLYDANPQSAAFGTLLKTIGNPAAQGRDRFGDSVLFSGNKLFVGAPLDENGALSAGAVHLFDADPQSPTFGNLLQTFLNPEPDSDDRFGEAIAAVGDFLIVGAPRDDAGSSADAGTVYVFDADPESPAFGNLVKTLDNPTPVTLPDSFSLFGSAIVITGSRITVAASKDNTPGSNRGVLYAFDGDPASPAFGELIGTNISDVPIADDGNESSFSLAASGDLMIAGLPEFRPAAGLPKSGQAFLFELERPSISINSGAVATNSTEVTLSLNAVDDFTEREELQMAFSQDGGVTFTPFEPLNAQKNLTLEGNDGVKTVTVRFRDLAGNAVDLQDTITLDRGAPAGTVLINNNSTHTNSADVTLTLDVDDTFSQDANIQMAFSQDGGQTFTAFEAFNAQKNLTLEGNDGVKTVIVRYRDESNNTLDVQDTITLDRAAPVGTVNINNNANTTNDPDVVLTLDANDAFSLQPNLQMAFSQDGGQTFTAFEPFNAQKNLTLTGSDGDKTVTVRYQDEAGNTEDFQDTITLDRPPAQGSIAINSGNNFTNSADITLTLDATDVLTPQASLQMAFSQDGVTFTPFEPFSAQKNLTLTGNDGVKTVTVRYQDKSNNTLDAQDTITLDRGAPAGSVNINNNATHTNSADVTLTLDVDDTFSQDASLQMAFSQDGITFTAFESFNTQKNLTLEGSDGDKTVTVRYQDEAGNTEDFQDTITLDRTVPAGAATHLLADSFVNPTVGAGDNFGSATASAGNLLIVGTPQDDAGAVNAGVVHLINADSASDTLGQVSLTLTNPTPAFGDLFGAAVAGLGNNVLVGSTFDDAAGTDAGAVYLFDGDPASGSFGTLLHTFLNPAPNSGDLFGSSVAVVGKNILIGAGGDDAGGTNSGAAYLFDGDLDSPNFGQLLKTFVNPTPASFDNFGRTVASAGNLIMIGATGDNAGAADAGAVYVFEGDPLSVNFGKLLKTLTNPNPAAGEEFGRSIVAVGGNIAVGSSRSEEVYLFDGDKASPTFGNLIRTFTNPTGLAVQEFGRTLTAAGTRLIVGVPSGDGTSPDAGEVVVFDADPASAGFGNVVQTLSNPTPASGDFFGASITAIGTSIVVGANGDNNSGVNDNGAVHFFQTHTGVSINNGAARTNSADVVLSLDAGDNLSSQNNLQMAFSQDGGQTFTAFEPFNANKALTFQGADGVKTVIVRILDEAGNTSDFSDTIILNL